MTPTEVLWAAQNLVDKYHADTIRDKHAKGFYSQKHLAAESMEPLNGLRAGATGAITKFVRQVMDLVDSRQHTADDVVHAAHAVAWLLMSVALDDIQDHTIEDEA